MALTNLLRFRRSRVVELEASIQYATWQIEAQVARIAAIRGYGGDETLAARVLTCMQSHVEALKALLSYTNTAYQYDLARSDERKWR